MMNHLFTSPFLVSAAALSLPVLVDAAVKGSLLLLATAVAVMALRGASASQRHLVWVSALVGLLMLPAMSLVLPQWRVLPTWLDVSALALVGDVDAADSAHARTDPKLGPFAEDFLPDESALLIEGEMDSAGAGPGTSAQPAERPPEGRLAFLFSRRVVSLTFVIWIAGAMALCLRIVLSRLLLARLIRTSEGVTDSVPREMLASLRQQFGIRRPVRLLVSDRRDVPMTWGIRTGLLLLPREADGWDRGRLRAVLLHELAHVRRNDALTHLVVQIACALYWFNPLVWLSC